MSITSDIKPMAQQNPRPRKAGGVRGGSPKTIARREQLRSEPGKWFVWKPNSQTGSETNQILRTLIGVPSLKGMNRETLPYQSTARRNDDGTWTVFARFVGENQEYLTV